MALPDDVRQLLEEQAPDRAAAIRSLSQRAAVWRDVNPLPAPLADEAVSRDSFSDTRD